MGQPCSVVDSDDLRPCGCGASPIESNEVESSTLEHESPEVLELDAKIRECSISTDILEFGDKKSVSTGLDSSAYSPLSADAPHSGVIREATSGHEIRSSLIATRELTKNVLAEAESLVEHEHDFLGAEALLAELEMLLNEQEWDAVLATPLFRRIAKQLESYTDIGHACCEPHDDWLEGYCDATKTQSIHLRLDPSDRSVVHYRVQAVIPAKMTHCLAVANEIQLMPEWNNLITGTPRALGSRQGLHFVLNYQMSIAGGMYKVDMFNEIQRFADVGGGVIAECIESVKEGSPHFIAAPYGYKRPQNKVKNVWAAYGLEHTVFIQAGTTKLPFAVTNWLAKSAASILGRFVVAGLVKNSQRPKQEDNPWKKPLAEDKLGLYSRLNKSVDSANSLRREYTSRGSGGLLNVNGSDLLPLFDQRRIQRTVANEKVSEGMKEWWLSEEPDVHLHDGDVKADTELRTSVASAEEGSHLRDGVRGGADYVVLNVGDMGTEPAHPKRCWSCCRRRKSG